MSTCALNTLYYSSSVSLPSIIFVKRAAFLSTRPIVLCARSFLLCMASPTVSSNVTASVLVLASAYRQAKFLNYVFSSEEQCRRTRQWNLLLVSAHTSLPFLLHFQVIEIFVGLMRITATLVFAVLRAFAPLDAHSSRTNIPPGKKKAFYLSAVVRANFCFVW